MTVSPDHVLWGYRILLDREPDNFQFLERWMHYADTRDLREQMMSSPEYTLKNGTAGAASNNLTVYADLTPYGFDGKLFVNLSDYIGLSVAKGQYEEEEVSFVKASVKPGDTFVDIGGNIGFFAVLGSHLVGDEGKVFTFEPVPATLKYLEKSIAANPFCSNVSITQAIITDRASDEIEIAFHPLEKGSGSTGGSYLVSKDDEIPEHMSRQAIRAEPLDKLLPEGQRVDFIKIDIEGAEPLAMKGAEHILKTQSPIIMSEVHTDQLKLVSKTDWRGYFDLMKGYGYTPFFFEDGKITDEADNLEDGKVYNVAFLKR